MRRKSILISIVGIGVVALALFIWWIMAEKTGPDPANKNIPEVSLSPVAQNWAKRLHASVADGDREPLNTTFGKIKADRERGNVTNNDYLGLVEIYQKTLAARRKATGSALPGEKYSGEAVPFIAKLSPSQKRHGDEQIYRLGEGIVAPRLVAKTTPPYTPEALKANVQGLVYLQAVVRPDGSVNSFKVLRGLGYGLEEKAIQEIANKWRFAPALKDGRPVNVRVHIEVEYKTAGKTN